MQSTTINTKFEVWDPAEGASGDAASVQIEVIDHYDTWVDVKILGMNDVTWIVWDVGLKEM